MQISLEEFSSVIAAIHAAAQSPERWPEVHSAVARLMSTSAAQPEADRAWQDLLARDVDSDAPPMRECEPSVKRLMALLAPHVRNAKQVQSKLAEALPGRLGLASLDRLAIAAFIVDSAGELHHLNTSARSLLTNERCAHIRNARFRFHEPALQTAFEAALRKATQGAPRSTLLPLSSCREDVYEVTVSPLAAGESAAPASLALVVIARPQPDAASIERRVRGLYGLTEAEARVMAALTLGGTVEEIAIAHGVRTSTVRAQVRSIFEKTGVHRQTDLVRLALSGAPLLTGSER